jgi:hypothetical protein
VRSRNRYPRAGDRIVVQSRDDAGLRSDGNIILIDREAQEVLVEFLGCKVIKELNYFEWNGLWCSNCVYVVDGIKHHPNTMMDLSCMLHTGGDIDTYSLEHLNWSSNEGGDGCWFTT